MPAKSARCFDFSSILSDFQNIDSWGYIHNGTVDKQQSDKDN